MREIARQLQTWMESGEAVALGTLVHVQKSAPRLPGAHCAVTANGDIAGAISAGCVESDLFEWSQSVLADGVPVLVAYDVSDADAMRIGLTCGGSIEVLLERVDGGAAWRALVDAVVRDGAAASAVAIAPPRLLGRRMFAIGGEVLGSIEAPIDAAIAAAMREQLVAGGSCNLELEMADGAARIFVESVAPPPRLVVIGATQTALPLCRMAKELDFHVTVIDPRAVYATDERLAAADVVVREWPDAAFARVALDDNSYVVTLTHDEKFDLPTLRAVLRSPARYIGALGSRRTHAKRVAALREEGFGERDIARIHAPVGLDLGGRAPAEIALSVLAEVVAVRFGRDPRAPATGGD